MVTMSQNCMFEAAIPIIIIEVDNFFGFAAIVIIIRASSGRHIGKQDSLGTPGNHVEVILF